MDQPMLLSALRLAAMAMGALLVGATVSVIRVHAVAFRRAPSGAGIVPLHVMLVSSGALSLTGSGLAGVLAALGGFQVPIPVRYGLYIYGVTAIFVSLVVIYRGQRMRVRRADTRSDEPPPDPAATPSAAHRPRHGRADGR